MCGRSEWIRGRRRIRGRWEWWSRGRVRRSAFSERRGRRKVLIQTHHMNTKRPIYRVPVPSTSFITEAYFDGQGRSPTIRFEYQKDGVKYRGGIQFSGVPAVRTRAERCCKVWHIDAYDTLVEVENSSWV